MDFMHQDANTVLLTVSINLTCSWADDQMVKALLEGIVKLPNIKSVAISVRSKNSKTQEMLTAFEKAQIFSDFKYQYLPYEEKWFEKRISQNRNIHISKKTAQFKK